MKTEEQEDVGNTWDKLEYYLYILRDIRVQVKFVEIFNPIKIITAFTISPNKHMSDYNNLSKVNIDNQGRTFDSTYNNKEKPMIFNFDKIKISLCEISASKIIFEFG